MTFSVWLVSTSLCPPSSQTHCVHSTVAFGWICLPVAAELRAKPKLLLAANEVSPSLSCLIKHRVYFRGFCGKLHRERRIPNVPPYAGQHFQYYSLFWRENPPRRLFVWTRMLALTCAHVLNGRSSKQEMAAVSSVYRRTIPGLRVYGNRDTQLWKAQQQNVLSQHSKKTSFVRLIVMPGADQQQIKLTVLGLTEEAAGSVMLGLRESTLLCRTQRLSVHLLALLCCSGSSCLFLQRDFLESSRWNWKDLVCIQSQIRYTDCSTKHIFEV